MPTAHGEGRFAAATPAGRAKLAARTALACGDSRGTVAARFPELPNGSHAAAAGVCNEEGNVLALMPHPDRALRLAQIPPWLPGPWGDRRRAARSADLLEADGPGVALFHGLARALAAGVPR